ncbi:MAG: hypothetical protein RSA06_00005 [Erysipelotrichaceae bacterium]
MRFLKKENKYMLRSERNKEIMRGLFNNVVEDGDDYQLVIGFSFSLKQSNKLKLIKSTYHYSDFIVGYTEGCIILLETIPSLECCGDPLYYRLASLYKTFYSFKDGSTYTIYLDENTYIQFDVAKQNVSEKLIPYVLQEDEANEFKLFFTTSFKK